MATKTTWLDEAPLSDGREDETAPRALPRAVLPAPSVEYAPPRNKPNEHPPARRRQS